MHLGKRGNNSRYSKQIRLLKEGDIVGIDVGTELGGWYGDTAATFEVGNVAEDKELISCAKEVIMRSRP